MRHRWHKQNTRLEIQDSSILNWCFTFFYHGMEFQNNSKDIFMGVSKTRFWTFENVLASSNSVELKTCLARFRYRTTDEHERSYQLPLSPAPPRIPRDSASPLPHPPLPLPAAENYVRSEIENTVCLFLLNNFWKKRTRSYYVYPFHKKLKAYINPDLNLPDSFQIHFFHKFRLTRVSGFLNTVAFLEHFPSMYVNLKYGKRIM